MSGPQSLMSVPRLDTAGIAELLGLSRVHVTDRIIKRVDFPKPFINVSSRTRYWRTSDVLAWCQKEKKRGGRA